jgi:hypothetical protein
LQGAGARKAKGGRDIPNLEPGAQRALLSR